jgi:hypothetical protein
MNYRLIAAAKWFVSKNAAPKILFERNQEIMFEAGSTQQCSSWQSCDRNCFQKLAKMTQKSPNVKLPTLGKY